MEEYRFSFETDEQYQGRVGQLEVQGSETKEKAEPKESAPQSNPAPTTPFSATPPSTTAAVTQVAAQPAPQDSSIKLVFPWWLTLAFLAVFLVLFITAKRRNEVHVLLPQRPRQGARASMNVDAITGSGRYDSDATLPVWRVTKIPSVGSQT